MTDTDTIALTSRLLQVPQPALYMLLTEAHAYLDYLHSIKSQRPDSRIWCYLEHPLIDCWLEPVPVLVWKADPEDDSPGTERLVGANFAMLESTEGKIADFIGKPIRESPVWQALPYIGYLLKRCIEDQIPIHAERFVVQCLAGTEPETVQVVCVFVPPDCVKMYIYYLDRHLGFVSAAAPIPALAEVPP